MDEFFLHIFFISLHYSNTSPNFFYNSYNKKIIQKSDISSIMMFFLYVIRPIFLKTKNEINYSKDRKLYKQFKDYLYENYP